MQAHVRDLGEDPERLSNIKLMILGNGRIGKTQIANRLRGEAFEEDAVSTHGIQLWPAPVPDGSGTFRIWDFGGQDIYFGTHALFLKSRAVFMVVWTPEAEAQPGHTHNDHHSDNQPLDWWLDYVRRFAAPNVPVIVVQNQLDRDGIDRGDHPAVTRLREDIQGGGFRQIWSVAYSARKDQRRGVLNEYLNEAAQRFNAPLIGRGRLKVLTHLRSLCEADQARPLEDRQHRTLSLEAFDTLCTETGQISDTRLFLRFLHNAGVVYWREGFFHDRIILDQSWALEAIYSVFEREKCLKDIRANGGRFSKSGLAGMVWDAEGHSDRDQDLFLEFMMSCGICFQIRKATDNDEALYVAPDHLPEAWDADDRADRWGDGPADAELRLTYVALPPTLMRNVIAAVGARAGFKAIYWRHGFFGRQRHTGAKLLVEQTLKKDWSGKIMIRVRGQDAKSLVWGLRDTLRREEGRLGVEGAPEETAERIPREDTPDEGTTKPLAFAHDEARSALEYFVSYAWEDGSTEDSKARADIVDGICAAGTKHGIHVLRDKEEMRTGDLISGFMDRLAQGDRIIVLLSDKYLKSPYCMYELYRIWIEASANEDRFRESVRLYRHKNADIGTLQARADYVRYWRQRHKDEMALVAEGMVGPRGYRAVDATRKIAVHIVDILELIADMLQPRTLEELETYAFMEPDDASPAQSAAP